MGFLRVATGIGITAAIAWIGQGCSSAPVDGSAPPTQGTGNVSPNDRRAEFHRDVEPILEQHCQGCHREGGGGPFSLVGYDNAKKYGRAAALAVSERRMPPWAAYDDATCSMQRKFKDDLRLNSAEVDTLAAWAEQGMLEGASNPKHTSPLYPARDLVGKTNEFTIAKPYRLEADGNDVYRCFPIDTGFETDKWIGGSQIIPGDSRVVHHVLVYSDPSGDGAKKADADGGYTCFGGPGVSNPSLVAIWAPGMPPTDYGADAGLKLKAGTKLVMQVHYHPIADSVLDQSKFALKVLPDRPAIVSQIQLIGKAGSSQDGVVKVLPGLDDPPSGPEFVIPANAERHTENLTVTIPDKIGNFPFPDLKIQMAAPHMHLAGVDMKVNVDRSKASNQPNSECLIGAPKYDFNWQRGYSYQGTYDALPTLSAGDTLRISCTYNNSPSNPNVKKALVEQRMSSPVPLHLGESTMDEMCLVALVFLRPATLMD